MRCVRLIPLVLVLALGASVLSGCVSLPNDAAAAGPHHPEAEAAFGWAQSGEFQ